MRMSITAVILLLLPSTLASAGARNQTNEELLASIPLLWDSLNNLKDDFDTFEEEDDTIEPPPDPNPVAAYGDGPMPKSFELPLHTSTSKDKISISESCCLQSCQTETDLNWLKNQVKVEFKHHLMAETIRNEKNR